MFKARSAFIAVLAFSAFAAFAVPASAQAATITVDQECIDPGSPATGGSVVTGNFTGMPTGDQYYQGAVFVSAHPDPGDDVVPSYGGEYSERVDTDGKGGQLYADGSGTFTFKLAKTGSELPDTLFIKARVHDDTAPGLDKWVAFAVVEVPVCGRGPDPDPDTDGDGIVDSVDNCDNVVNPGQEDNDLDGQGDACDADDDNDGVNDGGDNCQLTSNSGQENNDGDAQGDACDADDDNDGVNDDVDNCQLTSNPSPENNDGDTEGDACDADDDNDGVNDDVDNCRFTSNPSQANNDLDAQGDACDADDDNDGVSDGGDNCQFTANPGQRDDDQDGIGNACDGTFDSSDGKSSGGGWLTTSDGEVNFSSSAKSVDGVMAGNCVVTVGQTKIKCLTVDGYYQSATNNRAVFVGSATQDGVTTRYRIELTDNGEPGTSDHIEITTDAGFAAAGLLGGGNLQVHRGV